MSSCLTGAPRRNPLYAVLVIALIFIVIGAAAWMVTSSPALSLNSAVMPTRARPFAFVEIVKPAAAYTALPINLPSPSAISTETPTTPQTSEPTAHAEIVADTPVPAYELPVATYEVPASSYGGNKYILIDISEQHMYVYEGESLVYSFVSSTGMNNATRAGSFSVLDKIPNAYGATWDIWMPNWLGIYWAGSMENGIHALPILPNGATLWAGYLGAPVSYGCIVLGTDEAQLLYDWADIGTPVEIQW